MAAVGRTFVPFEAWVAVNRHQAVVVARAHQLLVGGQRAGVDVRSVSARWEYSLNMPAQLAVLRVPDRLSSVRSARWISLSGFNVEEQELIGAADRSKELRIDRPVKGSNEAAVALEHELLGVRVGDVEQVNIVVVRAHAEVLLIGRVAHELDPFCLLQTFE